MAFENIGIGGILTFNVSKALGNMAAAARGFGQVKDKSDKLSASMDRLRGGVMGLSSLGKWVSVIGAASIGGLVHEGIQFNKDMQSGRNAIALITATVTKTPLEENLIKAQEALDKLNIIAAQAPGETMDLVGIYQKLIGPMTAAHASQENILENTKATAIFASAMGRSFTDTGFAMSKLQAGQLEMGNDLHMMLMSMGLLPEKAKEWREMLPEQRLKRMNQILANFAGASDLVGASWEARLSTVTSIRKMLMGAVTEKLFAGISEAAGKIATAFFKNQAQVMATARAIGDTLWKAVYFVGEQLWQTGIIIHDVFTYLDDKVASATAALERMGIVIDLQILGKVIAVTAAVGALTVALSPVVMIVTFLAAKIASIVTIVSGLVSALGMITLPMVIIAAQAAAVFFAFRQAGEGPIDTLKRGLQEVVRVLGVIWEAVGPGVKALIAGFRVAGAMLLDMFQGQIAPFIRSVVRLMISTFTQIITALKPVFTFIGQAIAALMPVVIKLVSMFLQVWMPIQLALRRLSSIIAITIAKVAGGLMPVIKGAFAIIMGVISALMPVIQLIIDIAMGILVPVLDAALWIIQKIADVVVWIAEGFGWLADKVGGGLKAALEGMWWLCKQIGEVIDKYIIGPFKWLIDKLAWVVNKIGAAASAVGSAVKDAVSTSADAVVSGAKSMVNAIGGLFGASESMKKAEAAYPLGAVMVAWATGGMEAAAKLDPLLAIILKLRDAAREAWETMSSIAKFAAGPFAKMDTKVEQKQVVEEKKDICVKVGVNNKTELCIDGRKVGGALAKHETEIQERSGFTNTPWQNRRAHVAGTNGAR